MGHTVTQVSDEPSDDMHAAPGLGAVHNVKRCWFCITLAHECTADVQQGCSSDDANGCYHLPAPLTSR